MIDGHLEITQQGTKKRYPISEQGLVIGRSNEAEITLADTAVSKKHCCVYRDQEIFYLKDLESRNYTFLNGERVTVTQSLKDGDTITLGRSELRFHLTRSQSTNEPEQSEKTNEEMPVGIAIYPEEEEQEESSPASISESNPKSITEQFKTFSEEEAFLARIALSLRGNKVTPAILAECLQVKQQHPKVHLKEILLKKKYIDEKDTLLIQRIMGNILAREKSSSGFKLDDQENLATESESESEPESESTPSASDSQQIRIEEDREDRLVIKIAQTRGWISDDQVKRAMVMARKSRAQGQYVRLQDILLTENFLSQEALAKIKQLIAGKELHFKIDGYEILSQIGAGGMGNIYKARQISMDRLVAIKVLAQEYHNNQHYNQLFLKEARAVARLNHENIVAGFDFGEANGVSFFVMEYVDGPSLLEKLRSNGGSLDADTALSIISQVAKALEHASARGLIHRDIKPENILLTKEGVVKLCDLGLAQSTKQSAENIAKKRFGTPAYMSPERIQNEAEADIRSDIYALGVTLYRTIFGKLPFFGSAREIMAKQLSEDVPFPVEKVDTKKESLIPVIRKMMEKDPEKRYPTPANLLEDLQKIHKQWQQPPSKSETKAKSQEEKKAPKIPRKKRRIMQSLRRRRW